MKKDRTNYWSNVSKKPKGFSFVKNEPFVYTYEVPVFFINKSFSYKVIDKIFIKVKMIFDEESGFDIDIEKTKELIKKEIGTEHFDFETGLFFRDSRLFPYIEKIDFKREWSYGR